MFIEPHFSTLRPSGWIEVISGGMFSGKTEELIRRIKRALIAKQEVIIFKPAIDVRYDAENITSHDHRKIVSISVASPNEILEKAKTAEVVGIDEAQFFSHDIIKVCNDLADAGKRVIVAGLDMDYLGNPFGPMPNLMAIAEYVTKVHAVCVRTGQMAQYSHRLVADENLVLLGEQKQYEPLGRSAFIEARKKEQAENPTLENGSA
jgi:thymidine kinase